MNVKTTRHASITALSPTGAFPSCKWQQHPIKQPKHPLSEVTKHAFDLFGDVAGIAMDQNAIMSNSTLAYWVHNWSWRRRHGGRGGKTKLFGCETAYKGQRFEPLAKATGQSKFSDMNNLSKGNPN